LNPQSTAPESEQALLDALGRGETQAIATLYMRHGARMVAFAGRYVRDSAAAEDVVIGLLGRWLERPPQVRDAERISAFLATSVYRAAVDWIRRERAERGQLPRASSAEQPPRVHVDRVDLRSRLAAAIVKLSARERLLLETYYGRALTTEECMEQLGISRAAFHQRLHRARSHLAELLEVDK
jgi:RNA polymerase sigma factor (sigma-70 family)